MRTRCLLGAQGICNSTVDVAPNRPWRAALDLQRRGSPSGHQSVGIIGVVSSGERRAAGRDGVVLLAALVHQRPIHGNPVVVFS